jgi:hypothetical protein
MWIFKWTPGLCTMTFEANWVNFSRECILKQMILNTQIRKGKLLIENVNYFMGMNWTSFLPQKIEILVLFLITFYF